VGLLRRNPDLDIHLAVDVVLAVDGHGLAADIEEAVARERERPVGGLRGGGRERRGCDNRGGAPFLRPTLH
jgi:hypothetical protein